MPKNKVVPIEEAMSHIRSGMSIAIGGFIGQGDPLTLIDHLKTMDVGDLTIYENDAGYRDRGTVELVKQGKVKKIVASHIGTTPEIGKAMNEGRLIVEVDAPGHAGRDDALRRRRPGRLPHTHRHRHHRRRRQAGAGTRSQPAHPGAVGEHSARGHRRNIGRPIYRGTSRNFNVPAATCADFVIAEVENLYTMGEMDPEGKIHTSGIFVDAVVRADIEYCTMREENFNA